MATTCRGLETDALTSDRRILFEVAFSAIEDLVEHGVDELQVELILTTLTAVLDQPKLSVVGEPRRHSGRSRL